MYAIFVTGLRLELKFDEVSKLKIDLVSVNSDGTRLNLRTRIKNFPFERKYEVDDWPGDIELSGSIFMDPFGVLLDWMVVWGPKPVFLFCDDVQNEGGSIINTLKLITSLCFTKELRDGMSQVGIAASELLMYTGHALKRGSIQLYRYLGLRDES